MLDPKQPLWLPQGSVRALLAIFVVVVGLLFLLWKGGDQSIAAVIGFVGMALGYYLRGMTDSKETSDGA